MPTYGYQCSNCGHELEELQSMSEPPLTRCPSCQQDTLLRVMGGGLGLIFKGSGFYLTDYKKSSSPPASGQEKKTKEPSPGGSEKPPPGGSEKPPSGSPPSPEKK